MELLIDKKKRHCTVNTSVNIHIYRENTNWKSSQDKFENFADTAIYTAIDSFCPEKQLINNSGKIIYMKTVSSYLF